MSAYAVIKTGGKQMRAAVDDLIVVEKLVGEPGDVVKFGEVLLHADGSDVKVGAPLISDFTVWGEIEDQRRADKVVTVKKRRRKNFRRTRGHRQHETVVRITALGGSAPAAKPRAAKAEKPAAAPKKAGKAKAAADVLFLSAPNGEADDLKKLTGVGPAIEKKLNAIGIYHYSQIAGFSDAEIEKAEDALNMHGRFERDGWTVQAKALATGKE